MRILGRWVLQQLVLLIVALLVLNAFCRCASTPAELAARDAELHRRLEPCQYVAVEVDSGQVICPAKDCACHAELIRKTLGRGHVESNFPANQ
jgi:hypothetical protein